MYVPSSPNPNYYFQTSSSMATLEEFSSPLFHFPWPFLDNVDEGIFMLSQHHNLSINNAPIDPVNGGDHGATLTPNKRKHVVMKVPGKRDRHSKIRTAQGLRDRRIRLSLKVARKFFDLQDMLGFDKASKTIEWLFINSKDATLQAASEESRVEPEAKQMGEKGKRGESCNKVATTIFNNHLARKNRDKARARARERTKQKLMIRGQLCNLYNHEINSSPKEHMLEEAQGSAAVIEELWGMTRSSSSSSNFSYNSPDFAAASKPNAMLISPVDSGALAQIPQQLSKTLVRIQF